MPRQKVAGYRRDTCPKDGGVLIPSLFCGAVTPELHLGLWNGPIYVCFVFKWTLIERFSLSKLKDASSANTSSSRSSPPSKSSLFGKFLLLTIASTLDSISIILCLQIFGMSLWDHKTHIMDALVGLIVSLVHNSTILPHTDYYLIKMRS